MHTTAAFYESTDQAGAYVALNGVPDQHLRVVGDDIQVPTLSQVIAIAGGIDTTAANRARLVTPRLRQLAQFQIAPLNGQAAAAQEPNSPQAVVDLRFNPLTLIAGEQINFEALANPAAAQIQWGVLFLSDKAVEVKRDKIFTVRATSATALVAGTWTNVALVFDEDLPRGVYQVVGLFPISAGMIAARMVFVGTGAGGWRPGALGGDAIGDMQHPMFRYGELGVWGEFSDIEPPTIDCLAVSADATQEFFIDVVQVSAVGA